MLARSLRSLVPIGVVFTAVLVFGQDTQPQAPTPKKQTKQTLDNKLLENLAPELSPSKKPDAASASQTTGQELDELDRAVQSMRDVVKKLGEKDVSEATRKKQKSIIDDIDKLIEKLKQPPPPQSQSSDQDNSPQNQQQGKSQSQQPRPQQNSKGQSQQQTGTGSSSQTQVSPSKSAEAQEKERQRQVNERAAELARRRALLDEVWGHLPPSVREKLLNVSGEKLLPRYEELIRKYYESLAEPTDSEPRKR